MDSYNHIIPDNTIYNIKQIISNKFNIPIDSLILCLEEEY